MPPERPNTMASESGSPSQERPWNSSRSRNAPDPQWPDIRWGKCATPRMGVGHPNVALMIRSGCLALAATAMLAFAASADAAPVLVLHGNHTEVKHERFSGSTELPRVHGRMRAAAKRAPLGRPTRDALDGLLASGQIDQAAHDARTAVVKRALRSYRKLSGTRRTELGAVLVNADSMAAAGMLTPSRLEPVFLTIDRNRQWWTTGRLLGNGQRVSFSGSQVIWQYYRGQGIELQMLANFGKANALWSSRKRSALRQLVDEMVPLAADRGGAPAWEYYFRFGGGSPPWTSSISQGTAVQSLARAGQLLSDPSLTDLALRSLALFEQAPPNGVRVDDSAGGFYLIYSFAPKLRVLNAHLQAVIGLFDVAQLTGDPRAQALFAAGESEARAIVPTYDTGKWSLYDQSNESDLSYHQLVTGFLENLCKRVAQPVYCDTAARFKADEEEPPAVSPSTSRIRTGRAARISFRLDKISRVGMTVRTKAGATVLSTSAVVGRGSHWFGWSRPAKPGAYELTLTATDLAGNRAEPAQGTLRILSRP